MSMLSHTYPDDWEEHIDQLLDRADDHCPECDGAHGSHYPRCQTGYADSFQCQNEIDRRLGK